MRQRKLGQDISVSSMGLGCMAMSFGYGACDPDEAVRTLHRAVNLGVTLFDTAEMYGPYVNEMLVGKALKPFRDHVHIATKFGFDLDPRKPGVQAITGKFNSRPDHVKRVAEASLKRLRVEVIDIFFQHRVDPEVPIEDTVGAMADLVVEGKVRAIGLSEASSATIRRAHKVHPIAALQSEYSLWSRDVEDDILATCRELEIGFIACSPLSRGLLGRLIRGQNELAADDYRREMPRFQNGNLYGNACLAMNLRRAATKRGMTLAQLALAWLLHKGDDIVPIPGARQRYHLDENVAAAEITLTPDDIAEVETAVCAHAVLGTRYDHAGMSNINL
ncbi:aldo/keto reductase [Rhizobium mayense]|uniref:Aldo/keto reductase n=1 Tax=Rhizobium mayense TaxID=1312184 RepID=A0ABT7K524_9HYPH|nr:aldo/keto reductase [Rhizobium mayense]MDL2403724.1 aldo/keto reductase [Rhizobium mayense]